jgi:hypothetical protein
VARVQLTEERANVEARSPHQRQQLGQEHWRRRARRERWLAGLTTTLLWVLAAMAPVKQVEDGGCERDGEELDRQGAQGKTQFHHGQWCRLCLP